MSALWNSADMPKPQRWGSRRAVRGDGLSIDTRTLKPGDLFVALKGDARDGHEFVNAAFAAKAGAALWSSAQFRCARKCGTSDGRQYAARP
jgi:UDP-N-acetylmuramoyl-tripeptide--D-alanyl-D-alanine ligase